MQGMHILYLSSWSAHPQKHPRSTASGNWVFCFITWLLLRWAAKKANYLQNYQAPPAPQHSSREIMCSETWMFPRLTSTAWKAFACLTWLQPTVLSSAAEPAGREMETLPWREMETLLPHLGKGRLLFPDAYLELGKVGRLLKLAVWQCRLSVHLTRWRIDAVFSLPCKNK